RWVQPRDAPAPWHRAGARQRARRRVPRRAHPWPRSKRPASDARPDQANRGDPRRHRRAQHPSPRRGGGGLRARGHPQPRPNRCRGNGGGDRPPRRSAEAGAPTSAAGGDPAGSRSAPRTRHSSLGGLETWTARPGAWRRRRGRGRARGARRPSRRPHPGARPRARRRPAERRLPRHDGARMTAVALSPPRRAWLTVARQELRDLWLGGRALGLLLAFSLLLSAMTYLTLQIGVAVGALLVLLTTADAISGERERGTLESLLLAPVHRVDLVAGKGVSALSIWLTAFAIATPYVWFLARGVGIAGVALAAGFVVGTLLALFLAGLGLLVSSVSRSNRVSLSVSLFLLLA